MRKFVKTITVAIYVVALVVSCSNENLGTTTKETKIDPIKLEENQYLISEVIKQYNSEDLYYKSEFFRTVAMENGKLGRGYNNERTGYEDEQLDKCIKQLYESLSDDHKQIVLKNLDKIEIGIKDYEIATADESSDIEQINRYVIRGQIQSIVSSAFGEEKIELSNIEDFDKYISSSGQGRSEKKIQYKIAGKYPITKGRSYTENSFFLNAETLATLFIQKNDFTALKELKNKYPKIKLDIDKVIALQSELNNKGRGSSGANEEYNNTSCMTEEQLEALPHGAIIVKKGRGNWFNGEYDHAGLYNRNMAQKNNFKIRKPSVLTCYPSISYASGAFKDLPEFNNEEFGQHEPISNYSYAEEMVVLIPLNQEINLQYRTFPLGTKAVKSALDKFYKKGRWGYSNGSICKNVYSPLIEWNKGLYAFDGDQNRSNNTSSDLIYCSRIPWYGYKVNGLDLNSDPDNRYDNDAHKGYLITPDEIYRTTWKDIQNTKQVWGKVGTDSCGNDTYGFKNIDYTIYRKTTTQYDWKKIPDGFISIKKK